MHSTVRIPEDVTTETVVDRMTADQTVATVTTMTVVLTVDRMLPIHRFVYVRRASVPFAHVD
jgi:uncharacterized protein (UPF0248 family)